MAETLTLEDVERLEKWAQENARAQGYEDKALNTALSIARAHIEARTEKRANVQGYSAGIPWSLHQRAWDVYSEKYGHSQSAERIHERGGFHADELDLFIPGWREEVSKLGRLQSELAAKEAEIKRLQEALGPFAGIGGAWVDDEGWNELACKNDRICDWFGPSDFRRARRAFLSRMNTQEASNG